MTEHEADVVVVGSGAAGMTAALRAVVGGARVTVLETADQFGGTSAISGGGMWLPRTRLAREAGIDDSRGDVRKYLVHLTKDLVDEAVIDRFIDTAPVVVDFLEEHTALRFYVDRERPDYKTTFPGAADHGRLVAPLLYDLNRLGNLRPLLRQPDWEARTKADRTALSGRGMEAVTQLEMEEFEGTDNPLGWVELSRERVAKGIVPRGCALIASMLEVVAARGAQLVTSSRARRLTMDDGRVTGVVADADGEQQTYRARSGVVLAAGGFEWNQALWDGLVRVPGVQPLSPPFNRGDALLMAQQAGARLALLDQATWSIVAGSQPGQIVVNRSGRRFINECIAYNDYGKVLGYFDPHTYEFPNLPAFVISNRPLAAADSDVNRLGKQVSHGDVVRASGLRELAELIGVDADNLERTVAEFDRHAAEGRDPEFGRGEAGWDRWRKYDRTYPNSALAPLGSQGPFYAQQVVPRVFGTRGGPVIDEQARILDFEHKPIPGLYGAGNAVASPFGHSYPGGGGTLGPAVTFGYLAGESLTS